MPWIQHYVDIDLKSLTLYPALDKYSLTLLVLFPCLILLQKIFLKIDKHHLHHLIVSDIELPF